jgi:hypothetical protein
MSSSPPTQPIRENSISKVNDEISVGEDLQFQRKWWIFERAVWIFFSFILALDIAGVFGRGPAANAEAITPDGSMHLKYERIERYGTPSLLVIRFSKSAVHDGKIQLWTSDSLVKELGNQRILPQPAESKLQDAGVLYTFPSAEGSNSVEFALEPEKLGIHSLTFRVREGVPLTFKVFVMP